MNTPRLPVRWMVLGLLAGAVSANLHAGLVGTVAPDGTGGYTYTYRIDNPSGAFAISAWSLEFDHTPDWDSTDLAFGGDVTVPTGWAAGEGIPVFGTAAQDFYSFSPAADVLPGMSLGDFSFTSSYPPDQVTFLFFGAGGESSTGIIPGPGSIPDGGPGLGLSLVTVLTLLHFGRRSSP
jgi:hypothetical protein